MSGISNPNPLGSVPSSQPSYDPVEEEMIRRIQTACRESFVNRGYGELNESERLSLCRSMRARIPRADGPNSPNLNIFNRAIERLDLQFPLQSDAAPPAPSVVIEPSAEERRGQKRDSEAAALPPDAFRARPVSELYPIERESLVAFFGKLFPEGDPRRMDRRQRDAIQAEMLRYYILQGPRKEAMFKEEWTRHVTDVVYPYQPRQTQKSQIQPSPRNPMTEEEMKRWILTQFSGNAIDPTRATQEDIDAAHLEMLTIISTALLSFHPSDKDTFERVWRALFPAAATTATSAPPPELPPQPL